MGNNEIMNLIVFFNFELGNVSNKQEKKNHWTSTYLSNWLDQGQIVQCLPGLKGIQTLNNTIFLPKLYYPEIYSHSGGTTQGKVILNKNEYIIAWPFITHYWLQRQLILTQWWLTWFLDNYTMVSDTHACLGSSLYIPSPAACDSQPHLVHKAELSGQGFSSRLSPWCRVGRAWLGQTRQGGQVRTRGDEGMPGAVVLYCISAEPVRHHATVSKPDTARSIAQKYPSGSARHSSWLAN